MSDDLNTTRIRNILDFQELKITALNRGFIMLLKVLEHKGFVNSHDISWINRVQRDHKLGKLIDSGNLMERVLDITSKIPCPDNGEAAANLARSHMIKPKIRIPKL